jgi:hemoglobin
MDPKTKPSLYERLGGEPALDAAVGVFYDKVLADALLAPFFENLDMRALIRKQTAFMTLAFGGPKEFAGRDPREAHRNLVKRGLSDVHFDAVARHLQETLQELQVPAELIAECLGLVGGLRNEVLNR